MAEVGRPDGLPGPRRTRGTEDFDALYAAGRPPWDNGRPQPAFAALADAGGVVGPVLDVGCGTGEHALMAAAAGLVATGLDTAGTAIAIARRKAEERALPVEFITGNALELAGLGRSFNTVFDCGLFHVLEDSDRPTYVRALRGCMPAGAHYYMLCFSDLEPGDWGPRRIRQEEIRLNFTDGWRVDAIAPSSIEITTAPGAARAWLASVART
jgi:ubiquinone/menaquinone biosynthesis C-methylase UbiE